MGDRSAPSSLDPVDGASHPVMEQAHKRPAMPPIAQKLREKIPRRRFVARALEQSWGHTIELTVVTAVAYFLVARSGITLLKAEGVAVIWPALGLAVGCLIALGPDARPPVATGICLGIIAARLRAGGDLGLAIALGLCNTGGALLTARLIERWFGPVFKLENVSCVLGFLGATDCRNSCGGR